MPRQRIQLKPLSAGLKTDANPALLADGNASFAENVDFHDDSIRTVRGSRKLNNQTLLRPSLLCRPDPAYSPLYIEADKSVPLRGYATWPYSERLDIGGDFASSGTFPTLSYHDRRGRTFEFQISFRIPETFRMYERLSQGENYPASPNSTIVAGLGYGEGLDDCTMIVQKGGDRTAPMSWGLGIVNAGNNAFVVGGAQQARKSNYYLVFMWLDSPEWGNGDPDAMRYDLDDYSARATGDYSTQALRAVILDGHDDTVGYALEPGRTYHASVAVTLDGLTSSTWDHDGRIDIRLKEGGGRLYTGSFVDSGGGGTATNLSVMKGPTDSLRYLAKYGVRYSGRDAVHFGLGYRTAPWEAFGWIPYGHDSAAMEHKGFRMADIGSNAIADLYGSGYNLTCTHPVAGNTYLSVNNARSLIDDSGSVGAWGHSPLGPLGVGWQGYGGHTGAGADTDFNPEALRGYRVVFPKSSVTNFQGARMMIESYSEPGSGDYRLEVKDAENIGVTWASEEPFLICGFRWNQQAIAIQDFRLWSTSRDYTDPRVQWSMEHSLDLADELEPSLETLLAYLPFDDAGARYCRELVGGLSARLCPFSLAIDPSGQEGGQSIWLSGEGEALTYDMAEHPILARELRAMMQSDSQGFAVEISMVLPEAYYGLARTDMNGPRPSEYEASHCPDLVTWAVKDADELGQPSTALPLLTMGHHSWWLTTATTAPERRPQGFNLDVHSGLDSEAMAMVNAVRGHCFDASTGNWDHTAPWVGKRITIQVGIQPSPANRAGTPGSENEYRVYLAATPKGSLRFEAGQNTQAEFAYWSDITIQRKEIPRLLLVIGGAWNPSMVRGYLEYGARLIVDKVRIYGATTSGELPAVSGDVTTTARGKILGRDSLPQRLLEDDEIVRPLGPGLRTAGLIEGSTTVTAPGYTSFYTGDPEDSKEAVLERYLVPINVQERIPDENLIDRYVQELYRIQSVDAAGDQLTLTTPYGHATSPHAPVGVTGLIGYTVFDRTPEDLLRSPLSLGSGSVFVPGVSTTGDLTVIKGLFSDLSFLGGSWGVRLGVPFTEGGLATVLPKWGRGIVSPRRSKVTGVTALDSTVFASGVGALFRVDDRWQEDGPTTELRNSLAFYRRTQSELEVTFPVASDSVQFSRYENVWPYWSSTLYRDFTWVYDFWVKITSYEQYQTLMWLGCEYAHLLEGPAAADGRRGIGLWFRLSNGRPELVMEDEGTYAGGSSAPTDGRYIATAGERIPLNTWTHLRFYLDHHLVSATDWLRTPGIHVNGRASEVELNAVRSTATGDDWIVPWNGGGLAGSIGDTRNTLYLGVARDAVRTQEKAQIAALSQLSGIEFPGGRIAGRVYPLAGELSGVAVWRAASADAAVSGFPDFNPYSLDYSGVALRFYAGMQEGIGEHVYDAATEFEVGYDPDVPGVILSSPAIDLYNEFGTSESLASYQQAERRIYFANGGRPAYVTELEAGPVGIIQPNSPPDSEVERKSLWVPNYQTPGTADPEQDPIREALDTEDPLYHYSTFGNAFLRQVWDTPMEWVNRSGDANSPFGIFGLKFYWKPRSVSGLVPLYSARSSLSSGGMFLECVDGKARVGWYDLDLKKRVYVETSSPVFRPGYWYYVYLRKAVPLGDVQEGNWLNTFWAEGRRRRALFTVTAGSWAVGDVVENVSQAKQGVVTKVALDSSGSGQIEYMLFTGDTDFVSTEVVQVRGATSNTGTIDSTPFEDTGDALVIREFSKVSTLSERVLWTAKDMILSSISFTSEMPRSPNTTAVGQVTAKGIVYNGGASGTVQVDTASPTTSGTPVQPFNFDMIGMQWQFSGTASNAPEKVYRIAAVISSTQITVADEFGNLPNLTGITTREGGVFSGIELVKSDGYDDSQTPDSAGYPIEFMGSGLGFDPQAGVAPHSGEFASFGWGVVESQNNTNNFYSGFNLFQTAAPSTDLSTMGTDQFAALIYDATTRPGTLRIDSGKCFTAVDTLPYSGGTLVSSQPNELLEVLLTAESNDAAESLFWRYVIEPEGVTGKRRVYVTFYDAQQNVESNPSPALVVDVPEEDAMNPGGFGRLLLTNLPVSHQSGDIQRFVYMTEANGLVPFRVAIVPDNTSSSVSVSLDDRDLTREAILAYDRVAPPDCAVLGVSQSVQFYGDVTIAGQRVPSLLIFSKPFFPAETSFENFLFLNSGRSERITAMAEVNGALLVWKRDALIEVTVREGAAFSQVKSKDVGAPGPQAVIVLDRSAYWMSTDRGYYGYVSGSDPLWLSNDVDTLFDGSYEDLQVDPRYLTGVSLAVNRRLQQVHAAFRAMNEEEMRRRVTVELVAGQGTRYSLLAGPSLSVLGAADRSAGGTRRMLGGTEDGFVVELDTGELELHDPGLSLSFVADTGSTVSTIVSQTDLSEFADLEGIRGAPVHWIDDAGLEHRAIAQFVDGVNLYLDRAADDFPDLGVTVTIGAVHCVWRSRWLDLGIETQRKVPQWLDLAIVPQASGIAILEVFVDQDLSAVHPFTVDGVPVNYYQVDLSQAYHTFSLGEVRARTMMIRLRTIPPAVGVTLDVIEMNLSVVVAEPHA